MSTAQIVHCPNCGSFAERQWLSDRQYPVNEPVIQTACPACDYLMVMGGSTGRVLEAYAPGQLAHAPSEHHSSISNQPRFLVHTR